jgi:hypothetical protein
LCCVRPVQQATSRLVKAAEDGKTFYEVASKRARGKASTRREARTRRARGEAREASFNRLRTVLVRTWGVPESCGKND